MAEIALISGKVVGAAISVLDEDEGEIHEIKLYGGQQLIVALVKVISASMRVEEGKIVLICDPELLGDRSKGKSEEIIEPLEGCGLSPELQALWVVASNATRRLLTELQKGGK